MKRLPPRSEPVASTAHGRSVARYGLWATWSLILLSIPALAEPLEWRQLPSLPDKLGVAGAFAGVTAGELIVAGGANFPGRMPWDGGRKVWTDRIWMIDKPDGTWRDAGRLPKALGYGVTVTFQDGIILVGGSSTEKHHADVRRVSWKDGRLSTTELPALPIPLALAAGALVGDTLYLAGGAEKPGEQSVSDQAFSIDLSASHPIWREIPPIPNGGRMLSFGAGSEDSFYLIGGVSLEKNPSGEMSRVYLRECWRYHETSGWNRMADLPTPLAAGPSPAPVMNGRIILLGGDDGSRRGVPPLDHPGFSSKILSYDLHSNAWTQLGETPAPRATAPVVYWESRWIIPSGEVRPGVRSPEVWSVEGF